MKGYRFYAPLPDGRKSKSASKQYPMQPWTVATLKAMAERGAYVECVAIDVDSLKERGDGYVDCVGALMADNDQAVCSSSASRLWLRQRCTRIPAKLARKLHPALFRYLE